MSDKDNKSIFDRYLLALRKTSVDEKTEHTDRAALQTLLQALADEGAKGVNVQHEPKRVADKGAPDFKIVKRGLILGYVENKAIGENLDKVLKSDQIKRYKTLSQNIILTLGGRGGAVHRQRAEPACHSRRPVVPPAEGDQPQSARH